MGDFGKKISCKHLSEEKIACSASVIESLRGKKGKNILPTRLLEKKFLMTRNHRPPHQELNGRPQSEERKIVQKVKCARIPHD